MAIQITGKKVKNSPALDRIFVHKIEITQVRARDDAPDPVYRVDIQYQTYGVGDDGLRVYDNSVESVTIEDFLSGALERGNSGKTAGLTALAALEDAIAELLMESADIDSATNILQ